MVIDNYIVKSKEGTERQLKKVKGQNVAIVTKRTLTGTACLANQPEESSYWSVWRDA